MLKPEANWIWGWHLDVLCEHLEAVTSGQIKKLLISIPPGSSKSTLATVCWPAWEWIDHPQSQWLTGANDMSLALRDSVASRRLLTSDWYRDRFGFSFSMTEDVDAKGHYENDKRGFRLAVAVGGNIGGKKGDRLLLDDPNDASKVESSAERRMVNSWFDDGFWDRVNDPRGSARIIIAHRCHEQDLIGHVLKQGGWEYLLIPEEYEPERARTTALGWTDPRTVAGEWLRPERWAEQEKADALGVIGVRGYAARHQQDPQALEGNLFKREFFRYYTRAGGYYIRDGEVILECDCRRFMVVDLATSLKKTADYTVVGTFDDDTQGNLYVVDMERRRIEGHKIPDFLWEMYSRWQPAWVGIERMGFQLSVVQAAARLGLPVRPLSKGSKTKAEHFCLAAEVRFSNGQVWFPKDASWLLWLENELLLFPEGEHDDGVDVLSYSAEFMTMNYQVRRCKSKPAIYGGMQPLSVRPGEDQSGGRIVLGGEGI